MAQSYLILGWVALVIGIALKYLIGRRRFNRRTPTGMQPFKSYEAAMATGFLEWIFGIVATLLVLGGLFFIIFGTWYTKNQAKKQQLEKQEQQK